MELALDVPRSLRGVSKGPLLACLAAISTCVYIAPVASACFAVVHLGLFFYEWRQWRFEFASRHRRGSASSESHGQPPSASSSAREAALKNELLRQRSFGPAILRGFEQDCKRASSTSQQHETQSSQHRRRRSFPAPPPLDSADNGPVLSPERSDRLNMDHVKLTFLDYMWAMYFIGINSVLVWATGVPWLLVRESMVAWGWVRRPTCDAAKVVGLLLLEGIGELVHYTTTRETTDGRQVAVFYWERFPILDNQGALVEEEEGGAANGGRGGSLTVEVDLETRAFSKATLGRQRRPLSAQDTLVLVWFHSIFAGHVKAHSLANWAVNMEAPKGSDLWRNSLATVTYNYFGFTSFSSLCCLFHRLGWTSTPWPGLRHVIDTGIQEGIPKHAYLMELRGHTQIGDFIIKLRNHFLNCFAQHKAALMPGVEGEALFAATVLHSLDHQMMEWNIHDALWIQADSQDFQGMAELGRIVRAGFVPELPGLLFNRKLSQATDPFSRSVYAHAAKLDQRFADAIDTCIIRKRQAGVAAAGHSACFPLSSPSLVFIMDTRQQSKATTTSSEAVSDVSLCKAFGLKQRRDVPVTCIGSCPGVVPDSEQTAAAPVVAPFGQNHMSPTKSPAPEKATRVPFPDLHYVDNAKRSLAEIAEESDGEAPPRKQARDVKLTAGPQDGGMAFKPGEHLPPGWAVCYHPSGCNGSRRFPKTQDYFSRKMLKGGNKGGSKNRSCLRCCEIGKTTAQLAYNQKQRTGVKAGASFERRHEDPTNRAQALKAIAMFEQLAGDELQRWVAENSSSMHAFSQHIHSLCVNRGFVSFRAVLMQLMTLWTGSITGKGGPPAPRILNLGCGWTINEFDEAAAAAIGSDQQPAVTHLDLFDYTGNGRVVLGDMYKLEEALMGQEYDIVVIIDSVFSVSGGKASELVQQVERALAPGGVAGIYQVDGYLGEAALAIGRAAQAVDDLRVVAFEEGQRDAAAANAVAEADAVGGGGRATDKTAGGGEVTASSSSSASVVPPPETWRALMQQPARDKEQEWGLNYVVLSKPTKASPSAVALPRRVLRLPRQNGSRPEHFVIYTIGLPALDTGSMHFYHGQAVQRIGQRDGFETAEKRHKEHVKLLKDEDKMHDSPELQRLYDAHDQPEIRFDRTPFDSNDPNNRWGHSLGNETFAFTIYQREEWETYGGVCERAMRMEQLLIDRDPRHLNACCIASGVSFEISSAGGKTGGAAASGPGCNKGPGGGGGDRALELPSTKLKDHYGRPLLPRVKIDRGNVKCGDIITGGSICIQKAPGRSTLLRLTMSGNSGPKICSATQQPHPYMPSTDSLYLAKLDIDAMGQVSATNLDVPMTADLVLTVLQSGRLVGYVAWGGDALQSCPSCGAPLTSVTDLCECIQAV